MNLGYRTLVGVLALSALGCTEQTLPEFKNPKPMSVPIDEAALGPRLNASFDGGVDLSWMERSEASNMLRYSRYRDGKWTPAANVVEDPEMFVNWADLPGVRSGDRGLLTAHWLRFISRDDYAYQILTAHSDDAGVTWSEPSSPHSDGTATQHGFVASYGTGSGTGLIWLDGRNMPDGGMALRGAVIGVDNSVTNKVQLDERVCDCCQTDVAVSKDGPVAVYRDRSGDEVRDIYLARRINDQWQVGQPISNDGWVIDGCPVNGPAVDANGKFVVATWFTGANNKPTVKAVFSKNSGKTFSDPVEISTRAPIGRVGISAIGQNAYAVSWLQPDRDGGFEVNLRSVTTDGKISPIYTVGRTALARTVPQMVRTGDKLVLAWTDEIDDRSKVVSVRIAIADYYRLFES